MDIELYYINQIRGIENEISEIEIQIYQLEKDLDDLYEFQMEHYQMSNRYTEDKRKYRLEYADVRTQEVGFFAQHKCCMYDTLMGNQSQRLLLQKEDERHMISLKMDKVEQKIEDLKYRKHQLEWEMAYCSYFYTRSNGNHERFKNK